MPLSDTTSLRISLPADYNTSLAYPLNPDGTLNPGFADTFQRCAVLSQWHQGSWRQWLSPWSGPEQVQHLAAKSRLCLRSHRKGTTVVRGGFGMFFERVQGNDVYNAALNPPFAYQPSANNVYFSNPNTSALTGHTTSQTFPSTLTNLQYHTHPQGPRSSAWEFNGNRPIGHRGHPVCWLYRLDPEQ